MTVPNNEGKACDAVVRFLEGRTGAVRADVRHPERDGIGPPVDLRLRLGAQDYAIEHTQIEAFQSQIRTGEEFGQLIRPVIDELSGTLPGPAVYHLYFPIDARVRVGPDRLRHIRRGLVEWVRERAQRLHENNPLRPTKVRNPRGFDEQHRGTPPGFPFEVVLHRESHWALSSHHDGVLLTARYIAEDVEPQRVTRLRTALERKCPKLQRCREEGARTVLVMEDNDISLSNYVLIGDALVVLVAERSDLPDEIHLVETAVRTWSVRVMKCDDTYTPEQDWTDFDSADLIDMTGAAYDQR